MFQIRSEQEETEILNLAVREGTYAEVVRHSLTEFEEEHNVKCEITELSESELYKAILNSKKGTSDFDLCMVDGSWVAEFGEKNVLLNLSDMGYYLDNDIITETTDISYYNGDVYLAPFFGNVTVLLYNKELVQAAGYDTNSIRSFDDVLAICQSSQNSGNIGFLYRGDTDNNLVVDFLPVLLAYGGWVVDEENHPTVNTQEFKEAISFYLSLINTGKKTTKDDIVNAITGGHGAITIGWPGWYTPYKDGTADYCAIEGRAHEGSELYNANIYGIWGLGICENSTHPNLSLELLDFLMSERVQKASIDVGGVPCRYSCLNDKEVLEKYPQYEDVCAALQNGKYRPIISNWSDFMEILGPHLNEIFQGEVTIDDGLNQAQSELEELMGK